MITLYAHKDLYTSCIKHPNSKTVDIQIASPNPFVRTLTPFLNMDDWNDFYYVY